MKRMWKCEASEWIVRLGVIVVRFLQSFDSDGWVTGKTKWKRQWGPLWGGSFSQWGLLDQIEPAYGYMTRWAGWPVQLTESTFNKLDEYASSSDNMTYSLFLSYWWPVLIASTHRGIARLRWPGWLVTCGGGFPSRDGHPSQY